MFSQLKWISGMAEQNKAKQNKNTHHAVHRIGISKAKNRQTKAINK